MAPSLIYIYIYAKKPHQLLKRCWIHIFYSILIKNCNSTLNYVLGDNSKNEIILGQNWLHWQDIYSGRLSNYTFCRASSMKWTCLNCTMSWSCTNFFSQASFVSKMNRKLMKSISKLEPFWIEPSGVWIEGVSNRKYDTALVQHIFFPKNKQSCGGLLGMTWSSRQIMLSILFCR